MGTSMRDERSLLDNSFFHQVGPFVLGYVRAGLFYSRSDTVIG